MYMQFTPQQLLAVNPAFFFSLPPELSRELLSDPEYLIRICAESGRVEVGYSSDKWVIE